MRSPETFDAFYASSRDRLLHETYALTGDVAASRTAVRDSFAAAWHHWRKVATSDDPEEWVRSLAHRRARRRHSARLWHRDKSLDPEVRDTLAALSKLTSTQRQLLVLTSLSPLTMSAIAREVGLPRPEAERQLQTATSQFSVHRDVPSTSLRTLLEQLRGPIDSPGWPRATIIRRAGTARRRTHTAIGALIAAGAVLVSGTVVGTAADAQVTGLTQERMTPTITVREVADEPPSPELDEDSLLDADQVRRFGRDLAWAETTTHDNLGGNGVVLPCQLERFADPSGLGALVRTWDGTSQTVVKKRVRRGGKVRTKKTRVSTVRSQATEFVELSADADAAAAAFGKAQSWYAGCGDPRTQLIATRRVVGVGEDAKLFWLRGWRNRPASFTVGVARSGQVLVTTVVRSFKGAVGEAAATAGLAAAVNGVCGSSGAGTCADRARSKPLAPLPVADSPLLGVVDLPPVSRARGEWVGIPAPDARTASPSNCDRTSFAGPGIRRVTTRMYLFPETPKAGAFALTQTLGTMGEARARKFVDAVRSQVRSCGAAKLGTTVTPLATSIGKRQELVAWVLMIELPGDRTVPFYTAMVRDRGIVSQVRFNPDGPMTMTRADFVGVARRALQRLGTSPPKG